VGGCGSGKDDGAELERRLVEQGSDPGYARCLDEHLGPVPVDDVARLVDANSNGGYPALVEDVDPATLDDFLDANLTCTADGD
jgi:hypothetical protein